MGKFAVIPLLLAALALAGCTRNIEEIAHEPVNTAKGGMALEFGSAEPERYMVKDAPIYAAGTYQVNQWVREELMRWQNRREIEGSSEADRGKLLSFTLIDIDTDLDPISPNGGDGGWSTTGRQGFVSFKKAVRIDFSVSLNSVGDGATISHGSDKAADSPQQEPLCSDTFIAYGDEPRNLWSLPSPYNAAFDFNPVFQKTIREIIALLDNWECLTRGKGRR